MAAPSGKKESVSLSLFMEVSNLEVEEDLSTHRGHTLFGRKVCGREDGNESSRRRGRSKSLKYRHGDK